MQALHQLDPAVQQNLSILHELAFNDSHVGVSLAALEKLNNFDLWWKVAETASDKRMVKKARRKVAGALLGKGELPITDTIKRSFIMECQDVQLLEHLFLNDGIDANDTQVMLRVLQRLSKPQLNMRVLLATTNHSLQTALLEDLHSEPELSRLLKRTSNPHLVSLGRSVKPQPCCCPRSWRYWMMTIGRRATNAASNSMVNLCNFRLIFRI